MNDHVYRTCVLYLYRRGIRGGSTSLKTNLTTRMHIIHSQNTLSRIFSINIKNNTFTLPCHTPESRLDNKSPAIPGERLTYCHHTRPICVRGGGGSSFAKTLATAWCVMTCPGVAGVAVSAKPLACTWLSRRCCLAFAMTLLRGYGGATWLKLWHVPMSRRCHGDIATVTPGKLPGYCNGTARMYQEYIRSRLNQRLVDFDNGIAMVYQYVK
jgi:hypothetical protein